MSRDDVDSGRYGRRGARLLLEHCRAFERPARPSARARLEASIGYELTRALLRALTGDHRHARDPYAARAAA
jgi:hypothetical protein